MHAIPEPDPADEDGGLAAVTVTVPSGPVPSGAVPSGAVPSGAVPSGAVPPPPHVARGLALAELILARAEGSSHRGVARLPTERQLSVDLGVTRSSIRSALALLEAQGHISREVGRGTFLRQLPAPSQAGEQGGYASSGEHGAGPDSTGQHGPGQHGPGQHGPGYGSAPATADFAPADVMTIRRLLEPPAMVLVVAWATAADLEEMDRCLALGDRATTFEEFEACDLALHRCIMAASHSPLLAALYGAIEAARHGQVWGDLKRRSASPERRSLYQADHRAIVEALRSRDSGGAVEAMRRHLATVQEHLNVTDPAAGLSWR